MKGKIPDDLYFTEEHEWVRIEDEETRVGISDYAQDRLGEVLIVELPKVGVKVDQIGEGKVSVLGYVESAKAVSDVHAPLSGEVKGANQKLKDHPELINDDPYGEGWFCLLEPTNLKAELENLMNPREYEKYLESEGE